MRIQARNLKRTEILKILLNEYSRKLLTPTFLFSYFGYQMLYVNSRALDPDTVRILPDPDPGCFTWSRTSIEFRLLNKKMVIRFFCLYLNFILALFYRHTVLFLIFLKKKMHYKIWNEIGNFHNYNLLECMVATAVVAGAGLVLHHDDLRRHQTGRYQPKVKW